MIAALLCALGTSGTGVARAGVANHCAEAVPPTAAQHDRLLRFGSIVKAELDRSGARVALVSRSGLDLDRFGYRYSHAGVGLREGAGAPWAVRQLYFDCGEQRPRLFDEGMAAFVRGGDDHSLGYVSAVLLPPEAAAALERTALDNGQALPLLGGRYSANAYPYSLRYQNCNQWVAELLASAWRGSDGTGEAAGARERAQGWLRGEGYEPSVFDVGGRALMWLGAFIPWLHDDDHPAEDVAQMIYRVSMPASIEAFAQRQLPGAARLEFCHTETHVVVHRGWQPIADGCQAGEQDTVIPFD